MQSHTDVQKHYITREPKGLSIAYDDLPVTLKHDFLPLPVYPDSFSAPSRFCSFKDIQSLLFHIPYYGPTFKLEQFLQLVQFVMLAQLLQLVQSVMLELCLHCSQPLQLLQNEQSVQSLQLEH
jgi:hypothetical protein